MKRILLTVMATFTINLHALCLANPAELFLSFTKLSIPSIFPIKIAGIPVIHGHMLEGIDQIPSPICICPGKVAGLPQIGIPVGFYNPDRMIDVVKDKFCFMGLGLSLNMGFMYGDGGNGTAGDSKVSKSEQFFQVHNIIYPIFGILKMFIDLFCLNPGSNIDIAYITEIDPLWNADTLAAIIQPEALLFGNPIANLACAADSVASSTGMSIDGLPWCKGAAGNVYPLTGREDSVGELISVMGAASSFIYKSHRQLLTWKQAGLSSMCFAHPMPIWIKSSHRLQLFAPIPHITATWIGASDFTWGMLKRTPEVDNYSFFWFRKFDCCFL